MEIPSTAGIENTASSLCACGEITPHDYCWFKVITQQAPLPPPEKKRRALRTVYHKPKSNRYSVARQKLMDCYMSGTFDSASAGEACSELRMLLKDKSK